MSEKIYFASSVSGGPLCFIVECLEADGFNVESVAFVSARSYQILSGRSFLPRLWLRFCMYCLYPVYLALQVLIAPRKALFVVTSNTFYAPVIAAAICKLCGKRSVHLLWDLFPDVLELAPVFVPIINLFSQIVRVVMFK